MINALIIYAVVSTLVFWLMRKKINWIVRLAFIVCIPVFGIILLIFLYFNKKEANSLPDWLIQISDDDDEEILQKDQHASVSNVIPFKDALMFNDNQLKRKMLLNMLKKDSFQNTHLLRAALENEDTETSHFAATAIMDTKSKLGNSIQDLEVELDKDPINLNKLIEMSQLLKNYLEVELVDHQTIRKYRYTYSGVLERILELNPYNEECFIKKIDNDLELGEYQNARYYCDLFRHYFPGNEESYFQTMKLYYQLKDDAGFQQTVHELRNSSIKLSQKGLSKLRFWIQGEANES
ncbi:hypothetical protein [Aquibacillus albus]|uniref:Uncharacterized protein n=1 Tax=Aquibacillus albus TaxID=1168171 RepID=A0ABS2MVU4_9BACI|nr:hypothetical protein [Aquibacillus albus]MBM7570005.1 hypothetical protein [Aquibacillus albus]